MVAETPRIETDRLVLRRWDVTGDLDAWAAICADPEVMRYIGDGSIATRAECAERLGRAHWGQGFATEAARAALAFAWDPVGLDRVVSVHAVGNDPSGNVMRKIGMRLDRETVHPTNGRRVRVYAIDRPVTG